MGKTTFVKNRILTQDGHFDLELFRFYHFTGCYIELDYFFFQELEIISYQPRYRPTAYLNYKKENFSKHTKYATLINDYFSIEILFPIEHFKDLNPTIDHYEDYIITKLSYDFIRKYISKLLNNHKFMLYSNFLKTDAGVSLTKYYQEYTRIFSNMKSTIEDFILTNDDRNLVIDEINRILINTLQLDKVSKDKEFKNFLTFFIINLLSEIAKIDTLYLTDNNELLPTLKILFDEPVDSVDSVDNISNPFKNLLHF